MGVDEIDTIKLVLIVVAAVLVLLNIASFFMGIAYRKKIAEAEIDDEDIINYLIDNGITAEEVEYSK